MTDNSLARSSTADHPVMGQLGAVSRKAGLDPLADRLTSIRTWLGADLTALEQELQQLELDAAEPSGRGDVGRYAAAHLLGQPGKRIRPICVALGARLGGVDHDGRVCDLAVACELVHAATLLHDDVIDEGAERRGAPAARVVYGNSASVLGGDYLLIEALSRVQRVQVPRLLTSILDTIGQMVAAEALQLERRGRFEPDRASYMRVIEGKTASLFQWALSAGAVLGGMGEPEVAALSKAGLALGLVFQLVDDVLDLEGDPALTGKDMFADLLQGKLSWPIILATEADARISEEVRELCHDAARGGVASERAQHLVARIVDTGALEATRAFAAEQRQNALGELALLPESLTRQAIELVTLAALHRSK